MANEEGGNLCKCRETSAKMTPKSKLALQQTQEMSSQAMRDHIKFMSEKIEKAQSELEQKEMLVQQIELEKREAQRNLETMEVQNFEL